MARQRTRAQENPRGTLARRVSGRQKVRPGDTLWISEGAYRHPDRRAGSPGYVVGLAGQENNAIQVRALAGKRVTIDGGLTVQAARHVAVDWNLEILVSEKLLPVADVRRGGRHPKQSYRPWGGLNVHKRKGLPVRQPRHP